MFNLYEILRNAQGGHALDNLATQFGITAEEADAAVKAVVPALSAGFLNQASEPMRSARSLALWGRASIWPLSPTRPPRKRPRPRKRAAIFSAKFLALTTLARRSPCGLRARPASARTRWQKCSRSSPR
jgi:hypothetical protein